MAGYWTVRWTVAVILGATCWFGFQQVVLSSNAGSYSRLWQDNPGDTSFAIFIPIAVQRHDDWALVTPTATPSPEPTAEVTGTAEPGNDLYANCDVIERYDADDDGVVDRLRQFHYNSLGLLETETLDRDADGTIETTQRRVYSRNNLLTERRWYDGVTRNLTKLYLYEYDSLLRMVLWRLDLDGDAEFDRLYRYHYDDIRGLVSIEQDRDGDGLVDHVCRYNILVEDGVTRTECDTDNDGTVDNSELVTRNDGLIVEVQYDEGDDGDVDRVVAYAYDDKGKMIYSGTDGNSDGDFESWDEYDYDSNGLLVVTRGYRDKTLEYTIYDEYDPQGRIVSRHYDNVPYADATILYEIECGSGAAIRHRGRSESSGRSVRLSP